MLTYGLDIGGTKIETAIFDKNLEQVACWRVKTPVNDYQEFLTTVIAQIEAADAQSPSKGSIGIGMPGLIDHQGKVLSANIPCATGKLIKPDLEAALNRNVVIHNDTRCFALSEAWHGAGHNFSRVFCAIIGTGAAGGMCVDGKLQKTQLGVAGEYGHLPLSAILQQKYQLPILQCGCGLMGCVESYISGPGISKLYRHFANEDISAKEWHSRLLQNEHYAQLVLSCYLDILGEVFATLVKLMEPEAIVLGGGLSLVDAIVDGLPEYIARHMFPGFQSPKVLRAKYGDSSGVRGAAILGADHAIG